MADSDNITEVFGISWRLMDTLNGKPMPTFFSSYQSGTDALLRTASIGVAPAAFLICSGYFLFNSGYDLLCSIGNLCYWDFDAAAITFDSFGVNLFTSLITAGVTLVSPLINFADAFGALLSTTLDGLSYLLSSSDEMPESLDSSQMHAMR